MASSHSYMERDAARAELAHGCLIVTGPESASVDLDAMSEAVGLQSGWICSPSHAARLGALAVCGTPNALWGMEVSGLKAGQQVQKNIESAREMGMGEDELAWLDGYHRTDESNTLFSYLTGCNVLNGQKQCFPEDEFGFVSCVALLESVTALQNSWAQIGELNEQWSVLVAAWDALEALLNAENSEWRRTRNQELPRLRASIRRLIRSTGYEPAVDPLESLKGRLTGIEHCNQAGQNVYWVAIDGRKHVWIDRQNFATSMEVGMSITYRRKPNALPVGSRTSANDVHHTIEVVTVTQSNQMGALQ